MELGRWLDGKGLGAYAASFQAAGYGFDEIVKLRCAADHPRVIDVLDTPRSCPVFAPLTQRNLMPIPAWRAHKSWPSTRFA